MLETSQERIKLLKAGFTGKTIERLYIELNNIKVIRSPLLIGSVEFDIPQNKEACINCNEAVEYAQSFYAERTDDLNPHIMTLTQLHNFGR